MKKYFPYPVYTSFWFWWAIVTAVYLLLSFNDGLNHLGTPLGYSTGFFGMFVPIGPFSFMFASRGLGYYIPFLVVALTILFADKVMYQLKVSSAGVKILFNLLTLLLLTLVVDLILYGSWPSLQIFLEGGLQLNGGF